MSETKNGGNLVGNESSTKVKKQLGDTTPLQTLARWGQIDRRCELVASSSSGASRARGGPGTMRFRAPPDEGVGISDLREDDFSSAPLVARTAPHFVGDAEVLRRGGRRFNSTRQNRPRAPSRRAYSHGTPDLGEDDFERPLPEGAAAGPSRM
jgi:hypothetical protein